MNSAQAAPASPAVGAIAKGKEVNEMYQGDDRVQQVNEIEDIANYLTSQKVTHYDEPYNGDANAFTEDIVKWHLDNESDLPKWWEDHDTELLKQFVRDRLE